MTKTLYFIQEELNGTIETVGAGTTKEQAYRNWYNTLIEDTKAFYTGKYNNYDNEKLNLTLYLEETIFDSQGNVIGYDEITLEERTIY